MEESSLFDQIQEPDHHWFRDDLDINIPWMGMNLSPTWNLQGIYSKISIDICDIYCHKNSNISARRLNIMTRSKMLMGWRREKMQKCSQSDQQLREHFANMYFGSWSRWSADMDSENWDCEWKSLYLLWDLVNNIKKILWNGKNNSLACGEGWSEETPDGAWLMERNSFQSDIINVVVSSPLKFNESVENCRVPTRYRVTSLTEKSRTTCCNINNTRKSRKRWQFAVISPLEWAISLTWLLRRSSQILILIASKIMPTCSWKVSWTAPREMKLGSRSQFHAQIKLSGEAKLMLLWTQFPETFRKNSGVCPSFMNMPGIHPRRTELLSKGSGSESHWI
jgi:hypothetical protein